MRAGPVYSRAAECVATDVPNDAAMNASSPPEAAAMICEHMNDDHADAVAGYARRFAKLEGVIAARMAGIDAHGMDLDVDAGGQTVRARIAFERPLRDASDARATLIAMARPDAEPAT
jgi:putative heme iron utilization protein